MDDVEERVPVLTLLDGTKVYADGNVDQEQELSKDDRIDILARRQANTSRRTAIADLPVDGKEANIYTVIITYELIGLQPADIAFLLNIDIAHLASLVKLDAYLRMKDLVVNKLFEAEHADARAILAQSAPYAAAKMVNTMRDKGVLGYTAAKDIVSLQKINEKPQDSSMRSLEIVILTGEELDKRSVDGIEIKVNGV